MRSNRFQSLARSALISLLILCSMQAFAEMREIKIGIPRAEDSTQEGVYSRNRLGLEAFLQQYWTIWGEKYQYRVTFEFGSFDVLSKALQNKKIDVVSVGAIDHNTDKLLASIPFAYSGGALYERIGDKIKGLPVALHVPMPLVPENFNRSQHVIFQSSDMEQLLYHASTANYIFSWNSNQLKRAIEVSPLQNDFVLTDEAVGVPLRFLTLGSRFDLILDINRGIRTISPVVIDDLWNSSDSHSKINMVIGEYYQKLTEQHESMLVRSPFLTYAYVERGEEPYFISDDFELKGYTIDVLNDITAQLGITFLAKPYRSFQEALDAVSSGEVDVFPGVYRTSARTTTLDFTTDIDKASIAIISEQDYYSIAELKDLRIALVRGLHENDIVASILPRNPVIYLDTAEEAIEAVANGRADAFVGKLLNSIYLVDKHKYYSLNVHKALDVEQELWPRLAVNKSLSGVSDLLNHGIYSLGDDFQHELSQKWRNTLEANYQNYQQNRVYEQALLLGAVFSIATVIGLFFYRRQLNRRAKIQASLEGALFEAKEAKREAEEMALAKSDFLARMSHEIRTPMNGVLGMAEALSFTELDKEQTDLLQTLNGSARNLMALLNDVLDFSKMDAGKLTLEQVSCEIDLLVTGVVGNFKHKAKAKGLQMVTRIDPQLNHSYSCDSTRLMQVLNNLVSNSVKFTENGYVELTAQLITNDYKTSSKGEVYDLISLQVRDSGIGIPKEKLATLFDPFVQADGDITRRFGGTGLGLSISKEIVDEMGGEIKVSSVLSHGSLFNILLPVIRIEEHKAQVVTEDMVATQGDLSKLRVLFAEDNEVNRKVIGGQLKRLGVQFETAENGLIAYNKYLEDPSFDLVLSDCHMPEMDGFTLAGHISSQRVDGKPHLIAITADALSGAAKRCISAGFDDYISKPCPLDVLQAKLSNVAVTQQADISTIGTMLDHQQSFDHESTAIEEDLSWLAEFESVTPQPGENTIESNPELDIEWLSQAADVVDVKSIKQSNNAVANTELPEDVDWLNNYRQEDELNNMDLDALLVETSLEQDIATSDPLENLLAELEGIGANTDTQPELGSEFDLEDFLDQELSSSPEISDLSRSENGSEEIVFPQYLAFDEQAVLSMSGDDVEIAKEILDTFLDNYTNDIKELNEAYESKDLSWLKDVAHRIKGSALYLGSDSLSQVAKELEHASAEGVSIHAQERVNFISKYLDVLANEIEMYCETIAV